MGIGSLTPRNRAVFLDRDGVLNQSIIRDGKPFPPSNVSELIVNPDAKAALAILKRLEFLLIVVTNQPDVGRGTQTRAAVEEIHNALGLELPLDDFFVCFHDDADRCTCRKPAPGLVFQAASRYDIDLTQSFLVGDRWRDIDAGYQAGVRTIWIDYDYRERGPTHEPDARVRSLQAAVDWIVRGCDTI